MAEFNDANIWLKLAFLMTMLGFTCDLFAFSIGMRDGGDMEGAMICGFLFFLTAAVLIICLVFLDELNGNKIALICFLIIAFVAGLATIIGFCLWGGNSKNNTGIGTFSTTVGVMAAIMAILAGIFGILEVVGVSPKAK